MATRLRKTRRLRGSRTHGWGTSGQHRKGGMRGGHGKAGRFDHKLTAVLAGKLPMFGKKGFTSPYQKAHTLPTINVSQLIELVNGLMAEGKLESQGGKPAIDLAELGYRKLLGEGKIDRAVIVKVPASSKTAMSKIEEAGGQVILLKEGA